MAASASEPVFKVIRVVAASAESWETAARSAVAEISSTITDLHHARASEMDVVVRDGRVAVYRVKLEAVFRLDRERQAADGTPVHVRRVLVVANQTLFGPELRSLVDERMATGPVEFHVVVPCTPTESTVAARRAASLGDPLSGYVGPQALELLAEDDAPERARERLDDFVTDLAALGVTVTGEVGSADPLRAVTRVLGRGSFDEIILSTAAPGVSRWLKLDLPSRLERATAIPITRVTAH